MPGGTGSDNVWPRRSGRQSFALGLRHRAIFCLNAIKDLSGGFDAASIGVGYPPRNRRIKRGKTGLALLNEADSLTQDFTPGMIPACFYQLCDSGFKIAAKIGADWHGDALHGLSGWLITVIKYPFSSSLRPHSLQERG